MIANPAPHGGGSDSFHPVATGSSQEQPALGQACQFGAVFRLPSGQEEFLVTSLMDCEAFPACELADLYHRRWRIEECFNLEASVDRSFHGLGH